MRLGFASRALPGFSIHEHRYHRYKIKLRADHQRSGEEKIKEKDIDRGFRDSNRSKQSIAVRYLGFLLGKSHDSVGQAYSCSN